MNCKICDGLGNIKGETCVVCGGVIKSTKTQEMPRPKYAIAATLKQEGKIPIQFHIQAIDHKPTESDYEDLKYSLIVDYGYGDIMDLITIAEANQVTISILYSDVEDFRKNGIIHSDPHKFMGTNQ